MGKKRNSKQEARLALFDSPTGYEEKHIGNQWYIKQYNGTTKKWQVAVYSEDSFARYKGFTKSGWQEYKSPQQSDAWHCFRCHAITGYGPAEFLPRHVCNPSIIRSLG